MSKELVNRVCVVAGASGAIGKAIARRFQDQGASLALTYFSGNCSSEGAPFGSGPTQTLQVPLDIRRPKEIKAAVQEIVSRFGSIHVLVNCTGVLGPIGPTAGVAEEDWVSAIETNLFGSFYLTHAVLPTMLSQSGGKIVHFSGGGAAYARPFYTAYATSKAALVRFTESLAEELREFHIDINTIAPGPVNSRMWDQVRSWKRPDRKTQEEIEKMDETGGVPPERAAELALFLASDQSNGLSGRLISAVWDDWKTLEQRIPEIMCSDSGTLRRVPFR